MAIVECSDMTIIGNNISSNSKAGLDLDFSTESTVKYNKINDNGADGIEWETELEIDKEGDFFNTVISENKIINN